MLEKLFYSSHTKYDNILNNRIIVTITANSNNKDSDNSQAGHSRFIGQCKKSMAWNPDICPSSIPQTRWEAGGFRRESPQSLGITRSTFVFLSYNSPNTSHALLGYQGLLYLSLLWNACSIRSKPDKCRPKTQVSSRNSVGRHLQIQWESSVHPKTTTRHHF